MLNPFGSRATVKLEISLPEGVYTFDLVADQPAHARDELRREALMLLERAGRGARAVLAD